MLFVFSFGQNSKYEIKKNSQRKTIKNRFKPTDTAEVHAFIVVSGFSSSADCKTERTTVHEEKHNSPRRTHHTYSQSQVLFIYSIFLTSIHVYDLSLDL